MKRNSVLDFVKFFLSIMIVVLHTGGGGYFSTTFIQTVCRLAVPVFFMISGYFVYEKKSFGKYIGRMLFLYLIYTLVCAPIAIDLGCYTLGWESVLYAIVHGTFIQLWYFPSLILSVCILAIVYKLTGKINIALVIGLIFHVWGILSYTYNICPSVYELCPNTVIFVDNSPNNFLYFGLCYVAIGAKIREWKDAAQKTYVVCVGGLIVSIVLWFYEANYFLQRGIVPVICFGLLMVVVSGFYLMVNISYSNEKSKCWASMSTIIFGLHYIFYYVYLWYLQPMQIFLLTDGQLHFWFVLWSSVIAALIIVGLSKKIKVLRIFY